MLKPGHDGDCVAERDPILAQNSPPNALAVEPSSRDMSTLEAAVQRDTGSAQLRSFLLGLACAAVVGVAAGSFLVPFKYATDIKGAQYIVSFGIGALVASLASVCIYFSILWLNGRCLSAMTVLC